MRAVELGLDPEDLAALGAEHGRPEWVAGAAVLREYDEVTALSAPGAFDPAWVLGSAADLLATDADALDRLHERLRLVVVDDAQELTPAAVRLLRVVTGHGAVPLVLVGDPDAATQTFRGADPRLLAHGWPSAATHVLGRGHRCAAPVAEAAARVVAHVGVVGGVAHRGAEAAEGPGVVEAHLLRTAAQEAAFVAGLLREEHLLRDVPWSRMAVVVRGGARTATLRRVLRGSGVPVDTAAAELPVRDEAAARPFLALLRCAIEVVAGAEELDPEVVVDVLGSPVGGADAVGLRRLRRSLRRVELDDGGGRPSDVLLAEAVLAPFALDRIGPEATPARRVHRVLAAAVDALRDGDGVEEVLWAMWSASGLASAWRDTALGGGPAGGRADRDLDAVLGLFDAAARFTDRLPRVAPGRLPRPRPRPRTSRATPSRRAPRRGSPSPCSPPQVPPASSGTSSSSPASRRACGPTCGCAAPSSGPPTSSTSSPAARPSPGPPGPRCGTTRPACSTSRAPGPGGASSSRRSAARTSSPRPTSTSSTPAPTTAPLPTSPAR